MNIKTVPTTRMSDPNQQNLDPIRKQDRDSLVRERGTTRRSSILLNPMNLKSSSKDTSSIGEMSALHVRVSDNIAVRNMSFNPPPSRDLSFEEANDYANVIDIMLDQLELIKYTIPEAQFQLCLKDNFNSSSNFSTLQKLQQDRTYICNVLKNVSMDLRLHHRYDSLKEEIDNIMKTTETKNNLETDHEILTEELAQLNELVANEEKDSETRVKELSKYTKESNVEIDNALFLCSSRLGYIEKWERARLDQQKLLSEIKEQALQDKLNECIKTEKTDEITSSELQAFLTGDIAKMEKEIEIWSSRYNEEIELRQRDIEYFNERIKDVREALEKEYKCRNKRQAVIDAYENDEREKAKKAEYWTVLHRAATTIQSVWRGYMVRRQLRERKQKLRIKLKKRKKRSAHGRKKRKIRSKKT